MESGRDTEREPHSRSIQKRNKKGKAEGNTGFDGGTAIKGRKTQAKNRKWKRPAALNYYDSSCNTKKNLNTSRSNRGLLRQPTKT